jgi:glycine dehydrogenase subunit 1
VLRALAAHNVLGGFDLSEDYPELGDAILVCATELRTDNDIENYRSKLERVIGSQVETPVS